ncbi:MAG TPA: M20 family metallopeptidase [Burkholderiaceae bacterium]|nr:M20 family metallopeptidase [Burkholderiaceae bacterium]
MSTRTDALAAAAHEFDNGSFQRTLARRIAVPTESQNPERAVALHAYLRDEIAPALSALDARSQVFDNPLPGKQPFLIGRHAEDPSLPTVLVYGHGDVVRGLEGRWRDGRDPWTLDAQGERWYGRGSADNKGQHSINIAALAAVRAARGGRLGFNLTWLLEMGEETGSPGLAEFCRAHRHELAADVLIASDGPRLRIDRPTVYLGTRGVANFDLTMKLREGGHHSGNWGGLLRNPGVVLSHAIASLVDARGSITIDALRPPPIPASVKRALGDIEVGGGADDPEIDREWGEPGLTPAERVFGWNTVEVLAIGVGNAQHPVNAIPHEARATLQLRFVVGTDATRLREHVLAHLQQHGFHDIAVSEPVVMAATRLDPDNDWVRLALQSIEQTTGSKPALLPNLGGSLPNDVFADILGLPTVWVPHSYPACSQHAPNEHVLAPLMREGLLMMAGVFYDVGEQAATLPRRARKETAP